MQKSLNPSIIAGIVLVALLAVGAFFSFNPPLIAEAGSPDGFNEATTTTSAFASATVTKALKQSAGALSSVVISSSSPATAYSQITLYDATSTMATSTARVLARFGGFSSPAGTYMFDAATVYGVLVEVSPGYNGNATITWR